MILVIDVGNTNIVLGVYKDKELIAVGGYQQILKEPQMNMEFK